MDCRDRFAMWLVELVLQPVRALADDGDAGSVTVRAACGARRFNLTIARDGGDYRWSFREVAAPGMREPAAPLHEEGTEAVSDPEHAFWTGWAAIEQRVG
jgi:hypothetical protein